MTKAAEVTFAHETSMKIAEVKALADVCHRIDDMAAPISSGSFRTMGMVIAPCSVRSMSEIASGCTTTLLTRSADVVLKERRKLVLMVRETPLAYRASAQHDGASEMGAIIAPPVPAFYNRPESLGRRDRPQRRTRARPVRDRGWSRQAMGRTDRTEALHTPNSSSSNCKRPT